MSNFTLDTSGAVDALPSDPKWAFYQWSDLSPFAQGYVEAMFASLEYPAAQDTAYLPKGFSDLAPETLAAILKDCEAFLTLYPPGEEYSTPPHDVADGAYFWKDRQNGCYRNAPAFPPLTPYLGDDGKVYLLSAGQ